MEFIPLILGFAIVFLELVDELKHPVHLHNLYALPSEVHYEPSNLCWMVISDDLANCKLEIKAHCSILDRGYLVASLSFFYITIILLYVLCQGVIRSLP